MSSDLREFLAHATASAKVVSIETKIESWGLEALRGRFVELSARGASATLTTAIELVGEAQREHEPVAWIAGPLGTFYPPDAARSGVDLAALVVVRVPELSLATRAAERLLRSGAFGLVVIDLVGGNVDIPMAHQGRLVTLAQAHDAAVVCLTEKSEDTASIGSLVSLRTEALRAGKLGSSSEFEVKLRTLKDKRRGPGWTRAVKVRGPPGT
jgi:recombination protein RecA